MQATLYLWDTYPSDEVREVKLDVPVKPDGSRYPDDLTLMLLDAILQRQDAGDGPTTDLENRRVENLDGVVVLRGDFGRLEYSLYWHPTDKVKAANLAWAEYQDHLNRRNDSN